MSISEAAYVGASEVWGALIASALTTIAVFLPIVFLQDEAGQLFKDIAIAVTAAVTFSLFVSIFSYSNALEIFCGTFKKEPKEAGTLANIGHKFVDFIMSIVTLSLKKCTYKDYYNRFFRCNFSWCYIYVISEA